MSTIQADIWGRYDGSYETWLANTSDYEWTGGVPKCTLLVKLNPDITTKEREFILNGIRSHLEREDIVLSKEDVVEALGSLDIVFSIFVGVVAVISLFLAFFLLLISMTQNINDAIWEYGVLRSMGVTKAEGRRIYMYEAFMIVVTASLLGTVVGVLTSLLLTAQFYMFIELPLHLNFPVYTLCGMLLMALVTTWIAVYRPVSNVNGKQIAVVLKQGAA